jgi:methyltransferase family protein
MMGRMTIWLRLRLEDFKFRVREMFRRALRKLIEIAITDLDLMGSIRDVQSSAAFEREHLARAAPFKSRPQLYRHALGLSGDGGLFLEFGVYKGDSINRLAELKPGVRWYGFDSFVGLPEAWTPGARKGAFSIEGRLPPVRENVILIMGFFDQTLPPFAAEHPDVKVAFLHIDCDLYSATRTVFEHLGDRLQPGCIIVFDELINYAGWQDAEYKAFMEFVAAKQRTFEYIGYVRTGGQVAVRLT